VATEIIMPKLGLTMEQGTIGAWLVDEGDTVAKGAPLLEIITDKVTMEVEAQAAGVLRRILVGEGEEVEVSTPIGIIAAIDEDISAWESSNSKSATVASVQATPQETLPLPQSPATKPLKTPANTLSAQTEAVDGAERRPHRASPKARKIAAAAGIDPRGISGSGPGGRVVSKDVEESLARDDRQAIAPPVSNSPISSSPIEEGRVALTRPQQVAAKRLTQSYQQTPHIQLTMHVSAIWLRQFRQGYKLEGKKVSFNDMVVKAVAKGLVESPRLNSVYDDGYVQILPQVNIGVAVDTPAGLLVPVLRDVPNKSVVEIAAESVRLVDVARSGSLSPDEMAGGTFTISNLGMFGISHFTAIINPPQVAILAVGAIEDRVVALEGGAMAVRPMLTLTLAADHRVVDGAVGARFLARIKEIIETPGLLG
jgi:pyruvate dehydrogenase E2 component (dihydrolipoamide acetyltransferase)